MLDASQPPVEQEPEEGDPSPCPDSEALEGQLLPNLDEEQRKRFKPTELVMYRHAQDFRYWYIL